MNELYEFQKTGVEWLQKSNRRYLADDMGLGKTVQAIRAATELGVESPLVICPASAVPVWETMWREWGVPSVAKALKVVSYNKFARYPLSPGVGPQDLLILDEAHYCKNMKAQRTRAALALANRSPRVYMVSGTPMPNDVGELYAPLRAVWPDLLRDLGITSYPKFLAYFAVTVQTYFGGRPAIKIVGVKNAPVLKELLGKMMLRRTWDEVGIDMPPLRWDPTPIDIGNTARAQVNQELLDLDIGFDYVDEVLAGDAENQATARRLLGEAKAEPAAKLIAGELETGAYDKVVVMAYHRNVLNTLERHLEPFGTVRLDGRTSSIERGNAVQSFQTDPSIRVFIGQLTAAGVAITLHAAHEIVLVEQMWSPEDNHQAVKRIHRIGQGEACRARVLAVPGTVDDQIARSLVRKIRDIGLTLPKGEPHHV